MCLGAVADCRSLIRLGAGNYEPCIAPDRNTNQMKAIVYHSYGSADVLTCREIDKPVPKDDEVLIKVCAAALNPLDWRMMKGVPFIFRIMMKMPKPTVEKPVGVGRDVAGVVETVGGNVTQFKPGDEVFGTCAGAIAEYVSAKESALVKKPQTLTFQQAASIPVAGLTALQGLRDKGKIQAGQKVLINGASGGVGTFAVQLGKSFGAYVSGVCSTRNLGLLRSIGADTVIDYTQQDFTKESERYDIILECVGNKSFAVCRQVLSPKGRYVIVGAGHDLSMIGIMASTIKSVALSSLSSQKAIMFIAKSSQKDLTSLGELIATRKVTPVIDRVCTSEQTPDAVRHLEGGHARGKVIVTLGDNGTNH